MRPLLDVVVVAALALFAAFAALTMPAGSPLRFWAALPILLLAPGYLLLQAVLVPARPPRARAVHALLSVGLSPALVGLLALMTAIIPGGFRELTIILVVTVFCIVAAIIALMRRWTMPSAPEDVQSDAPATPTTGVRRTA